MEDNAELESFRRQWREEVASRNNKQAQKASPSKPQSPVRPEPRQERFPPTRHEASKRSDEEEEEDDDDEVDEHEDEEEGEGGSGQYSQSEIVKKVGQLNIDTDTTDNQREPDSALEHFERAVEKEAEGSLGDSLQHYRKAYRVCSIFSALSLFASSRIVLISHLHSWTRVSTRPTGINISHMCGRKDLYKPQQFLQLHPKQRSNQQKKSLLLCLPPNSWLPMPTFPFLKPNRL